MCTGTLSGEMGPRGRVQSGRGVEKSRAFSQQPALGLSSIANTVFCSGERPSGRIHARAGAGGQRRPRDHASHARVADTGKFLGAALRNGVGFQLEASTSASNHEGVSCREFFSAV